MTAIDWLIEQLIPEDQHEGIMDIIEDAKEREKQQIINSFINGDVSKFNETAEQYYNQTFKQD